MIDRPFPCHAKRLLAWEQDSYIGMNALHSGKAECVARLARPEGQTGIPPCALKVVVSASYARCNHLLLYSICPTYRGPRGPPTALGFSQNSRKRCEY